MKYEEAMKRLEEIVGQIEGGKLDIDMISERLKEAQTLIKLTYRGRSIHKYTDRKYNGTFCWKNKKRNGL